MPKSMKAGDKSANTTNSCKIVEGSSWRIPGGGAVWRVDFYMAVHGDFLCMYCANLAEEVVGTYMVGPETKSLGCCFVIRICPNCWTCDDDPFVQYVRATLAEVV